MSDEQPPQILSTIHINKVWEVTVYKKEELISASHNSIAENNNAVTNYKSNGLHKEFGTINIKNFRQWAAFKNEVPY